MAQERLQKVLAQAGVASRRKCEQYILDGRIRVNGKVVKELGTKVNPQADSIEFDGKKLRAEKLVVVVLNKPRGVVSTASDPEGRPTVVELVKKLNLRLFPVGRLDYATSGALLLTNDGTLAHALTHPKFKVEKTYHVKVKGRVTDSVLEKWRAGVTLDDGETTLPAKEVFIAEETPEYTWLELTIREGRNRQIRRMAESTGLEVTKLKRISFAGITIEKLAIGTYRQLTERELFKIKRDFLTPARRNMANTARKNMQSSEEYGYAVETGKPQQNRAPRKPRQNKGYQQKSRKPNRKA